MIARKELNARNLPETPEIAANLDVLCERLNLLRANYGKPMIITSGLRSAAQQAELIQNGKSNAPKSRHLTGEAADILDTDGKLKEYVKNNLHLLELIGLWCEDFAHTPNWLHAQISAPKSGKRVFIP